MHQEILEEIAPLEHREVFVDCRTTFSKQTGDSTVSTFVPSDGGAQGELKFACLPKTDTELPTWSMSSTLEPQQCSTAIGLHMRSMVTTWHMFLAEMQTRLPTEPDLDLEQEWTAWTRTFSYPSRTSLMLPPSRPWWRLVLAVVVGLLGWFVATKFFC